MENQSSINYNISLLNIVKQLENIISDLNNNKDSDQITNNIKNIIKKLNTIILNNKKIYGILDNNMNILHKEINNLFEINNFETQSSKGQKTQNKTQFITDNLSKQNSNNIVLDQGDIPQFKLLFRGDNIDEVEYHTITHSAADCLNEREDPLSNAIGKKIKKDIGGKWMIFNCVEGLKGYDFSITELDVNNLLTFIIKNFRFHICRIYN